MRQDSNRKASDDTLFLSFFQYIPIAAEDKLLLKFIGRRYF